MPYTFKTSKPDSTTREYSEIEKTVFDLISQGKFAKAESLMRRQEKIAPNATEKERINSNLAHCLLSQKKWTEGWARYENRESIQSISHAFKRNGVSRWNGEPLRDHIKVLVWGEQGLGDQLFFARWLDSLKPFAKTASISLMVESRLTELFAKKFPFLKVFKQSDINLKKNPYDFHIPLTSLPFVLKIKKPLVKGEYQKQKRTKKKNNTLGLSWRGGVDDPMRGNRTIPFDTLYKLAQEYNPDKIICLQHNVRSKDIKEIQQLFTCPVENASHILETHDAFKFKYPWNIIDRVLAAPNTNGEIACWHGIPTVILHNGFLPWRFAKGHHGRCFWFPNAKLLNYTDET